MLKVAGPGPTGTIFIDHRSSTHTNFYQLHWIIVDVTDPILPVQIDPTILTTSPTMSITRQLIPGDNNYWEPISLNPIPLDVLGSIDPSYISGGVIRYTIKNLEAHYEVWLRPAHQ